MKNKLQEFVDRHAGSAISLTGAFFTLVAIAITMYVQMGALQQQANKTGDTILDMNKRLARIEGILEVLSDRRRASLDNLTRTP